jgi:lipopolysaccharide biosynthesis glycosyltransferase
MQNSQTEPVVIAVSSDDNYAMPMAVTIHSLLSNLEPGRSVHIYVLDGGIRESYKQKILSSIDLKHVTVSWIRPSGILAKTLEEKVAASDKWPLSSYYRILLPQIVPQEIKKIIYLDVDTVVQGDLAEIWDIDIADRHLLAVPDVCDPLISGTGHLTGYKDFGIADDWKYFNAGVLVINLEKWRTDQTADKILDFLKTYPQYVLFADQDGLNMVLANQWGELPPKWNQMHAIHDFQSWQESPYSEEDYQSALHDPAVIHFTTVPKPWQAGCIHPQRDLFYKYLDMTPWAGWRNSIWRRAGRRVVKEIKQLERVGK